MESDNVRQPVDLETFVAQLEFESRSQIFDTQIRPALDNLLYLCRENGMPFVLCIAVDKDEKGRFIEARRISDEDELLEKLCSGVFKKLRANARA